jgi:hypothetical protein
MTKYLVSFPSGSMVFPDEDLQAVSDASHAVVEEAKDAGVWVFGGGIDESVPPVLVDGDGTVTEGTYPQTKQLEGGYTVLELPSREAALEWAAKIAVACRCAQEVRAFQYDPASRRGSTSRGIAFGFGQIPFSPQRHPLVGARPAPPPRAPRPARSLGALDPFMTTARGQVHHSPLAKIDAHQRLTSALPANADRPQQRHAHTHSRDSST